jgi:hypothetical protein
LRHLLSDTRRKQIEVIIVMGLILHLILQTVVSNHLRNSYLSILWSKAPNTQKYNQKIHMTLKLIFLPRRVYKGDLSCLYTKSKGELLTLCEKETVRTRSLLK